MEDEFYGYAGRHVVSIDKGNRFKRLFFFQAGAFFGWDGRRAPPPLA